MAWRQSRGLILDDSRAEFVRLYWRPLLPTPHTAACEHPYIGRDVYHHFENRMSCGRQPSAMARPVPTTIAAFVLALTQTKEAPMACSMRASPAAQELPGQWRK